MARAERKESPRSPEGADERAASDRCVSTRTTARRSLSPIPHGGPGNRAVDFYTWNTIHNTTSEIDPAMATAGHTRGRKNLFPSTFMSGSRSVPHPSQRAAKTGKVASCDMIASLEEAESYTIDSKRVQQGGRFKNRRENGYREWI